MHHRQKGWHRLYKQSKVQVIQGAQLSTCLGIPKLHQVVVGSCTLSAIILIWSTWSNQGYLLTKWAIHGQHCLVWGGSTQTLISGSLLLCLVNTPDTRRDFWGCQSTLFTSQPCPAQTSTKTLALSISLQLYYSFATTPPNRGRFLMGTSQW